MKQLDLNKLNQSLLRHRSRDTIDSNDTENLKTIINDMKPNWLECIFSSAKRKLRESLGTIQHMKDMDDIYHAYNKTAFEYEKDTNFTRTLSLPRSKCVENLMFHADEPWFQKLKEWREEDSSREEAYRRIVSVILMGGDKLNLEGCIGDESVLPELTDDNGEGPLSNVKHINLANNKIDLSSLKGFLGKERDLESLSLRSCGVTDESIKNLELPGNVKQLSLAHNELKDINSIGKLKGKNIHTLFLNHNKFTKIVPDNPEQETDVMQVLKGTMVLNLATVDKFAPKTAVSVENVKKFLNNLANDKDNEEGKPSGKEVRISWSLLGEQGEKPSIKRKLKDFAVAKDQKGKEMRNSYHVQFVIPKKEQNNL